MTPETKQSLLKSIKHWEQNAEATTIQEASASARDCALCMIFLLPPKVPSGCRGCPVKEHTGQSLCRETPYEDASRAFSVWKLRASEVKDCNNADAARIFNSELGTKFRQAAQEELEFLRSLLPPEA